MADKWAQYQEAAPAKQDKWAQYAEKPAAAFAQPKGSAASRAAGGFWDTTVGGLGKMLKMGADLVTSGPSPGGGFTLPSPETQEALTGIVAGHVDQARKAKEAWDTPGVGGKVEAFGHGLAAAIPLVGPAAAHAGERMGGSAPKFDKYGNVIEQGQAPDIAGGVGEGLGLLTTVAAPAIARKVSGIPAKAGVPDALQSSAERQYNQVLGATTKPNKFRSQRVVSGYEAPAPDLGTGATVEVPGLLERGTMAATRKGLAAKLNATVQDIGGQLEGEWSKIPDTSGRPAADIYATIDNGLTEQFMKPDPAGKMQMTGPDAQAGYDFGQSLKEYLKSHEITDPNGQAVIPYKSIKQFRQAWDDIVAAKSGYAGADFTTQTRAGAYKASADGLRDILNTDNPTVAALNREFSFWRNAEKVIGDTNSRTSSQAKPLGRKIARGVGQTIGGVKGGVLGAAVGGEVMDAIEAAISSPAWKTVAAVAKSRLADALASGNAQEVGAALGQMQRMGASAGSAAAAFSQGLITPPRKRPQQPPLLP